MIDSSTKIQGSSFVRPGKGLSLLFMAVLLTNLSGCTWFKEKPDFATHLDRETNSDSTPEDVVAEQKIRWDGGGVIIGETDSLAFGADSFLTAIQGHVQADRVASAQGLVLTYPDIALQTLQESEPAESNKQTLKLIASLLDSKWNSGNAWQDYVRELDALPRSGPDKLDSRTRFWRYLKNHKPAEARKLKLTRKLSNNNGPVLRAELHRLESIAAMMNEQPDDSIEHLEKAIQLTENVCPWYASKQRLLLGEFYRHANRWDAWKSTWEQSVIDNSRLAKQNQSVDPQFWNRAAFLRPAGMAWPPEAVTNLKSILAKMDVAATENSMPLSSEETVVWFSIGVQHLLRSEGQTALLAFKKAEASESNHHTSKVLQLYQARSLVATGQPGAASAILFRMVSDNEGTSLADRAKAILSSMKLQNGSVAQGLNLIQSAMQSVGSWPLDEQMRARADYGLALLMRGQETEGLRQLDLAMQQFEKAGQWQQARQCLWNRAKYFEKTEQKEEYRTASERLTDLESRLY